MFTPQVKGLPRSKRYKMTTGSDRGEIYFFHKRFDSGSNSDSFLFDSNEFGFDCVLDSNRFY